jgi:hypothetical protein
VRHLDAAFARIWTLNDRQKLLELQASAGLYTRLDDEHARVPVGQFQVGLIAEERKPHLTNDLLNDIRVGHPDWAKQDITQRKQVEAEMLRTLAREKQLGAVTEQFCIHGVTRVSHAARHHPVIR